MDISGIVQEIQLILAPAVMISSSALLLLGFQNKFSSLASRFRVLNHEKRGLNQNPHRDEAETERLRNLESQITHLVRRASHVKNVVLLSYAPIVCFVLTSVTIFLGVYTDYRLFPLIIGFFLIGFLLILVAALTEMVEVALAFKVVDLESRS